MIMNNQKLADKYASRTMIGREQFVQNLDLVDEVDVSGAVIECGVWRGGMLAAIAEKRPDSLIVAFDSFQGLPPAKPIDGSAAIAWQADKKSPIYYDNCTASEYEFRTTMADTGMNYEIQKGWFEDTVPKFVEDRPDLKIAILRLDGDWYHSTKVCLDNLYQLVVPRGLIIVDDYAAWQGCRKATDEFLKANKLSIQEKKLVYYFRKPK